VQYYILYLLICKILKYIYQNSSNQPKPGYGLTLAQTPVFIHKTKLAFINFLRGQGQLCKGFTSDKKVYEKGPYYKHCLKHDIIIILK
jgi:hypothetical protein